MLRRADWHGAVTPACSIVVINKDDRGIAGTLQALVALEAVRRREAEVIVVDASEGRLADLARRFDCVRWVDFQPIAGQVTIPHQRNAGVRASTGDIVVFIDASCLPADGWLEGLCAPLRAGEETIVAGSHLSVGGESLRDQATHRLAGRNYLEEAPTINLAVRREVVEELGGFDESFAYGSDVDLSWRAVSAGHRIRYVPDAVITHDWGGAGTDARRSYVYGRARARLFCKHRERWPDLLGRDAPVLVYPLYLLVLLPLSLRRPYLHLALVVPLWRNRGRRPVLSLAHHFLYGLGVLREVASTATARRRPPG